MLIFNSFFFAFILSLFVALFILFFVNWISLYFFHLLLKNYHIMFIIIVFWLGCERLSGLFFCACVSSVHARASSYHLCLFLYLISFLLFPCMTVSENTHAWVPHFLLLYWMVLFFPTAQLHVHKRCLRQDSLV